MVVVGNIQLIDVGNIQLLEYTTSTIRWQTPLAIEMWNTHIVHNMHVRAGQFW